MTDRTHGTAAAPSTKPANARSQCPYAAALSEDEISHTSLLTAELSQCPAFNTALQKSNGNNNNKRASTEAGGSASKKPKCPFEGATSKEAVQKTLASIPKSHYAEHQSSFFQVMQHMHTVHEQQQNSSNSDLQQVPPVFSEFAKSFGGQCPMQPYVAAATSSSRGTQRMAGNKSFARAMEDCSMAAIMARLVEDMQEEDDSQSNLDDDDMAMTPRNSNAAADEQKSSATGGAATAFDAAAAQPLSNSKNPHSLAEALKTGTAVSHQAAEDVHFVKNFISGKIDRHLYQEMIMGLYHVYVALEDALDQHAALAFPSCHFPHELRRREALQDDVEFWHNTRTPSPRTISPATQDYIDRIHYLANTDPLLLLAHSYTRYLGDLSGGRILARVARKALDLDKDSGEGLAFYRFEKVQSYKEFKDNYRQALDALPLTPQQIQALVAEANVAFCFNMRLFQELDVMATIPGARVMSLEEVMEYADKGKAALEEAAVSGEDQCPFLVNKKKKEEEQSDVGAAATKEKVGGGRCPWPFVFAHDPGQGMRDWQTWLVVALLVAWLKR